MVSWKATRPGIAQHLESCEFLEGTRVLLIQSPSINSYCSLHMLTEGRHFLIDTLPIETSNSLGHTTPFVIHLRAVGLLSY